MRKYGLFNGGVGPVKTWDADYMKLADRDKVEIYRYEQGGPFTGVLVAAIHLDKGQNVSETAEEQVSPEDRPTSPEDVIRRVQAERGTRTKG